MAILLVDHNLEGHAQRLMHTLMRLGWADLLSIERRTLADVGLDVNVSDRMLWRFAQAQGMLLLTDNRSKKGEDSLEQTLREEVTGTSLPVLTVGNAARLVESEAYRASCAERIAAILIDLDRYRGTARQYIP